MCKKQHLGQNLGLGAVQGGKGRTAIERKGKVETIVIAGLQHQGEGKTTRQANIYCVGKSNTQ